MKLTPVAHDPFHRPNRKAAKASVDYSHGKPHAHCGICQHYRDHACTKVTGHIEPQMWCELFAKMQMASGGAIQGFAEGGPPLLRTAPFPEKPEGYEFYGPADGSSSEPTTGVAPDNDILAQEGVSPGVSNVVGKMVHGVGDWIATPGRMMEGVGKVEPEIPGQWSEEDQYRQNLAQAEQSQKEIEFGGQTALNMFGTSAPFVPKGSVGVVGGRPPAVGREYPLAPKSEWYGEANYENTGGQLSYMTPDEFLKKSRPLEVDDVSRENINDLKRHMEEGKSLDPLSLYEGGKEDGRHRAIAAKELGIDRVPVIDFRKPKPNQLGFYSAVDRAIADIPQEKATGQQWAATLRNRPGVKPEELKWMGLDDWLRDQKGPVTKQQVSDYVRANQIEVKEVVKGDSVSMSDRNKIAEFLMSPGHDTDVSASHIDLLLDQATHGDVGAVEALSDLGVPENMLAPFTDNRSQKMPKFSQWQMPGGESYRELLLTLPTKKVEASPEAINNLAKTLYETYDRRGGEPPWERIAPDVQQIYRERAQEKSYLAENPNMFQSSHYDEPNILAHIRFNDRTIDGKRTLFLEEVQSDWHQKGRKQGYQSNKFSLKEPTGETYEVYPTRAAAEREMQAGMTIHEVPGTGVPDAPFKTTWPELAMKRMIKYAAENGYDKIAWTPGEVQAARYDLSKHIDKLEYVHGSERLRAFDHNGRSLIDEQVLPDKLADHIGKDAAEKLLHDPTDVYNSGSGLKVHALSGLDLKVGGEGMAGFYDKMLPAAVNKLVKKYGAKVDKSNMQLLSPDEFIPTSTQRTPKTESVHSLDITPSLRKGATEEGFPQFASGGQVKPRLTPVAHNPFEVHNAIRRAIHGH